MTINPQLADIFDDNPIAIHIGLTDTVTDRIVAEIRPLSDAPMVHDLDLAQAHTKSELLATVEEALQFPTTGGGYNSASDWLSDMDWFESAIGHVVILRNLRHLAQAQPTDFSKFIEILPRAIDRWRLNKAVGQIFITGTESKFVDNIATALQKSNKKLEETVSTALYDPKPVTVINHQATGNTRQQPWFH